LLPLPLQSLKISLFDLLLLLLSPLLPLDSLQLHPCFLLHLPLQLIGLSLFIKSELLFIMGLLLSSLGLMPFESWYALVLLFNTVDLEVVVDLVLIEIEINADLLDIIGL
jgi:hypothetical protein